MLIQWLAKVFKRFQSTSLINKMHTRRVSWIARYRLKKEIKEGRYWAIEEERKCRLCREEEETWEHVWEACGRSEEKEGG